MSRCWAFDLVDPWGNLYELNCDQYEPVRAELVETGAVEPVRYWPRELHTAYVDAPAAPVDATEASDPMEPSAPNASTGPIGSS